MKKIISLLLAALMILGLCGCGTGLDLDANDLIGSSESEETGFQSEEASTSSEEQEPEDITGKIENNLYKNEFLGITFNLPSGWTFYTEDQIADINKQATNKMDGDTASLVQSSSITYDMYAQNPTDGSNVNLNLEKFSLAQMLTMDVKKVIEGQFDMLKSTYENMGFKNVNVYYDEIMVDGKKLDGARLVAENTTATTTYKFYAVIFCFKKGSYLVNVSLGSVLNDKSNEILNCFKFL